MSKAGRIDTSNRIVTESYSSRGGRYLPVTKAPNKKASIKLRKGEIVFGQVLEKVSKELFKIKLPNGIFKAIIHPSLKQGDRLYFLIKDIEPSLVISVHSTDLILDNGKLNTDEIIRVLDITDSEVSRNIILEYSQRVNRLLRHVIIDIIERVDDFKKQKKKYNLTHTIEFILLDLYLTGYNIKDKSILNLVLNYISPSSIRLEENTIIPNIKKIEELTKYNSSFLDALYARNIAAKLNEAQTVYYININGNNYRVELFKKHKILQAIISDEKNIDIKIVINQRDKRAKIYYKKLDINIRKIEKIANYDVSYELSDKIFINSYSESMDGQNQKITYVI
jgi:hypothetical protein